MELTLTILYLLILVVQFVLLILTARKPSAKGWKVLFLLEVLSVLGAVGLMFLFDALPGNGFMPGLTWFAKFFYSLLAAAAYMGMLLLSGIVFLWKTR